MPPSLISELRDLDQLETRICQQSRDDLFRLAGPHDLQALLQSFSNLMVVLLDLEPQATPHPLAQGDISTAMPHKTQASTTAFDIGIMLMPLKFIRI
jgi:hypothetical protein